MFKCKECGKSFEVKPEYCDCGNDEFIQEGVVSANKNDYNILKSESILKKWFFDNLPSLIIFIICLIMSVIILLIKNDVVEEKTSVKTNIQNTSQKAVNWALFEDNGQTEKPEILPQQEKKITETPKTVSTEQKNKTTTTNSQRIDLKTQKTSQKVSKQMPVTKPIPQQNQVKTASQAVKKTETTKTDIQLQQQKLKQQLTEYKRNITKIFNSRIDFATVIGSGSCDVTFKIDSSGKVFGKAFSKQSNNTTLNDAVFAGVQQVNRVPQPPSNYKGETLTLHVEINNGNYALGVN